MNVEFARGPSRARGGRFGDRGGGGGRYDRYGSGSGGGGRNTGRNGYSDR